MYRSIATKILLLPPLICGALAEDVFAETSENGDGDTDRINVPIIEVTGTRLKRTDIETSSPVDVITREDIEHSGKTTLSDVVRSISADNNGSISTGNVSGFAMGSSGIALRGLAVNATLVLINGRRMTSYGLADDGQRTFVNLSDIPLDIVDRVEVLKDGGSAIYGSDAIAGVVNIILRDQFQGLSGNVSYGFTEDGGGETPRVAVTGGRGNLASDGYNVFFNLEASGQKAIYQKDREERKWIGTGDLRPFGYSLTAGGIGPNISGWFDNTGVFDNMQGVSLPNRFGAVSNAALATPVWQQLPGCNSTISLPAGIGGCAWDRVKDYGVVRPEEDKLNLYVRGAMNLSEVFNPYVEFGVFKSDVKSPWVLGPTNVNESWVNPSNNSVMDNSVLALPAGHPDNPLGANAILSYLTGELGSRTFEHDSTAFRTLLGTKGKLGVWDYDAGLLYAHNTTERTVTGFVRDSVLKAGLNGTGPFGFYRLGVNSGLNSAAFLRALSPTLSTDNTSSLTLLDFKASRDLLDLPGGPMGLSVGAEYRRETLDAPAMPLTDTGDIIGWSYYVYKGEQKVASAFAEVNAPVFKSLNLDGAVRVDKVWDSETSVTPKVGFKWLPWDQLAIRGTYAEGFRAPNPAEKGSNNQFAGTLDISGNGVLGIFQNTSNPNLKPEESKTLTLGAVFEPWRMTSLGVNFWWLRRDHEINSVDPGTIANGGSGWPHATVVRDAFGNAIFVSTPFENNSRSRLHGIDFDVSQRLSLNGFGTLTAKLNWAYLASYRKTFDGGSSFQYAGTHGPTVVSGNTGTPKNRANLSLAWERGPTTLSAYVNFVDGFLNKDNKQGDCLTSFADGTPAPHGCRIASFTTVDLHGSYKPTKQWELYLTVMNLFDRIAPLDPAAYINLNFNPSLHLDGAIGRTFILGGKYDF